MKILNCKNSLKKINKIKKNNNEILDLKVLKIIDNVKKKGDKSIYRYTKKFDKVKLKKMYIKTKNFNFKKLNPKIKKNLKKLINRVYIFHKIQKRNLLFKSWFYKDKYFNTLGQKLSIINKVAIYIPAGRTIYPSSLVMSAIPAIVSGIKNISVISPIDDFKKSWSVIYICKILGLKKIYTIGGAQAISGFTFGTKTIKPVDKIVGPGNYFVSNSKKILYGNVGIDMIAGPTELMIACDREKYLKFVVLDSLAQMEHDPKSLLIIVSNKIRILKKIYKKIYNKSKYCNNLIKSLENSKFIFTDTKKKMFKIINKISPEHLEFFIKNSKKYINKIKNSGSIFLGSFTTECLGDYSAGCNHILPTKFCSRFSSPLGVYDFYKYSNITNVKKNKRYIFKICSKISRLEKLKFHTLSLLIRQKC
ncbi:histidinol dehydrogenase [Candidatus Vidania fulgoroideorum]